MNLDSDSAESDQFFIKKMELQRNFESKEDDLITRKNWLRRNLSAMGLYHLLYMAKA